MSDPTFEPYHPDAATQPSPQYTKSTDDIPDYTHCPECGQKLGDSTHRVKHAVSHYGDAPLRDIPQTLIARQRRAFLMDEAIPKR